MTAAQPTRRITDPKFKYRDQHHTDIRRTFRKARLLQYFQKVRG